MAIPTLIYCAGGNKRFYEIATEAGFRYGVCLPDTVYGPLYFADQDWKNPNKEVYINKLSIYKPHIATVLDWQKKEQLPEVLEWAEEIAQFVEVIVIVPKVHNVITLLPRTIGNKKIRLGYSVPTRYGGTELMISEFYGWDVHLLGGSPHKQMMMTKYLNVVSADGNMAQKMATQRCAFYEHDKNKYKHGHWPTTFEADGEKVENGDAPYEAFRRSCHNIIEAWKHI